MNYLIARIQHKSKLLLRKILRLVKFTNSIKAYREEDRWFVKDMNGFSKDDNELVLGVPEFIEKYGGQNAELIRITYSVKPMKGSVYLKRLRTSFMGTTYQYDGDQELWLCPVLFWYFPEAPKALYVKIKTLKTF